MTTPKKSQQPVPQGGEIILYQTEDGQTRIQCRFEDEAIWLTQKLMADLFQKDVRTINEHLQNIYEEGELAPGATIRKFRIVQNEGARQVERLVDHYHLNAILAVGFRVRSQRGTQFRQWAMTRLEEYLRKGFTMDDERLKHPPSLGVPDYFDELLERIRDIRASEKRVYLQVRNILALAADYDPADAEAQVFFQTVQNKLHFAATGKTAPELIAERADATRPNMGPPGKAASFAKAMSPSPRITCARKKSWNSTASSPCISTTPRTRPAAASCSICATGAKSSTPS